jgi:CubicO group peptidase (beta-lactamase class C family)
VIRVHSRALRPARAALALAFAIDATALAAAPPPEAQARARLDALWQSNQVPGISAAVVAGGRIVFSGGAGFADLDNLVPATGTTAYNIGSVSTRRARRMDPRRGLIWVVETEADRSPSSATAAR